MVAMAKDPQPEDLSGDEQQQTCSDTIALEELNKRRKLDDFTAKETTEWGIKDVKTRKRELRDWWKMKNVRIQAEVDRLKAKYGGQLDLNLAPDDAALKPNLSGNANLTLP